MKTARVKAEKLGMGKTYDKLEKEKELTLKLSTRVVKAFPT